MLINRIMLGLSIILIIVCAFLTFQNKHQAERIVKLESDQRLIVDYCMKIESKLNNLLSTVKR